MTTGLVLAEQETLAALRRWTLIVPGLVSSTVALITMVYGFRTYLGGTSYDSTFATGWVAYAMVMAGVAATVAATVDLSSERIRYLLSLPVTPTMIVLSKLCGAASVALLVSIVMLLMGNPLVLHFHAALIPMAVLALLLQALAIVGLISTLSGLVRDLTKLGLVTSLATGVLHYVSTVYFPPGVFPSWLRPLIYLNPLSHSVDFLRSLMTASPNYAALGWLSLGSLVCLLAGNLVLTRSLARTLK